jgi:hypothetical protein
MSQETGRRNEFSVDTNADKVRKVIEDICKRAGASVAIEERAGSGGNQPSPRQHLHITYTGEAPMPYPSWFKLVNTIDEALDSSGLIDWESSELSEENEQERMATWKIASDTD